MNGPDVNHGFVRCTNCGYPQPGDTYNGSGFSVCPHCGSKLAINAFPALYRAGRSAVGMETEVSEDTATCFYHPSRPAVVPCGSCGRYLCVLCEVDLGKETICPNCMDLAARSEDAHELVSSRTLYDTIALAVAVVPMLFFFVTPVTAPLSLYVTVRHWRTPLSILSRSRVRFVLAFLIAGIQVLAWSAFLVKVLA